MQDFTITNAGRELMAKLIAGSTTANFTKVKASDHDYTGTDLETLTELQDVKQEVLPSDISREDNSTVKVTAVLSNSGLTEGYYIRTIGLYAVDSDGTEILYAASVCGDETPDRLPTFGERSSYSITYDLFIRVDNAENVTLELNPAALVTVEHLDRALASTSLAEKDIKMVAAAVANNTHDIALLAFQLELKSLTDSEVLTNVCVDTITSETSVNIDKGKYTEGKVYI